MAVDEKSYTRSQLEELIKDLMNIEKITPTISKQISRFVLEFNMSFLEIARCLDWYVEVFNGDLQPIYGIGIVPSVREQAARYFKRLELDQQKQEETAEKVVEYQDNNIIFNIKALPHKKRKAKQFNIAEIIVDIEDGV